MRTTNGRLRKIVDCDAKYDATLTPLHSYMMLPLVRLVILAACASGYISVLALSAKPSSSSQNGNNGLWYGRSRHQSDSLSSSSSCDDRRNWILQQVGITASLLGAGVSQPAFAQDDNDASSPSAQPYTVALQIKFNDKRDTVDSIEIEVHPEWSPLAAERFHDLVSSGFYDDGRFFRVLPGYVAQFGIASDPNLNKEWMFCEPIPCRPLMDEPRIVSNRKGTVSFASIGKNSRQTQVFINLGNNGGPPNFLGAQGFVPFAQVTKGMDLLSSNLNSDYGLKESLSGGLTGSINQGKAAYYGKEYLDTMFPGLSYIESAQLH